MGPPDAVHARPEAAWLLRWDRAGPPPAPPRGDFWPAGSVAATDDGGWVAVVGRLLDTAALGRSLGLPGTASDADLAAAAYGRWGAEAPRELRGSWLLMAWRPTEGVLDVVRDAMGLQPAYVHRQGDLLQVSSSLQALMATPEVSRTARREALAELLALRFPMASIRESFLEDVERVPAAHRLRATRQGTTLERWWDPLPEGFAWCTPEEVAAFPDVLGRAVARVVDAGADSIALSGGYDSVGLAAIAARTLHTEPPLHAVSLRFPGESMDEAATQRAVADALAMPQTMIDLDAGLKGTNLLEAALEPRYESPSPVLGIWNSLYTMLFVRAHEAGCRHMIFGTGGDEMLALDFSHAADCLRGLRVRELWAYLRAAQRSSPFSAGRIAWLVLVDTALKTVAKRAVRRVGGALAPGALAAARRRRGMAQLPDWIRHADPALVESLADRHEVAPDVPRGRDAVYVDRMRRLAQSPLLHMEFDQAAAWGQSLGLTAFYPFFDRDVVGLSLRMDPQDLIAAGRMKSPLRTLVRSLLPEVDMPSRKVDFTALMHQIMRTHGPAVWQRLGGPRRLAEMGVVSPVHTLHMWSDYVDHGRGDALRPWLLLSTEIWLRTWDH